KRACSVDLTARATEYARFNEALNDCENIKVLQGDLYEPVRNQTFDCIVAHPPYVPSVSVDTYWRDGGAIGDIFIKRIVEEMPTYLRAGGYALILAQGVDTREGRFEERARRWLGEREHEFDIIFASEKERGPQRVLELLGKDSTDDVIERLREAFAAADVVSMPYGALFLRRAKRSKHERSWTIRAKLSSETSGADFHSTFALHDRVSAPDFAAELARITPRLAPRLEVQVTHVVHEGSLAPAEYIFIANRPFAKRVRMDDWAIGLFMRFDGQSTVAQIYEAARDDSEMPVEFDLNEFILLVTRSLEAGFLVLSDSDCRVSWTC
ncbi:MAG TPA: methyltransferase, partial [Pyrinomonadaceae bacterium]|nr:methyltransferase [Pyrinomonadaceae bacterium]